MLNNTTKEREMTQADEYAEALAYVKNLGYNNIREYVEATAEQYGIPVENARWLLSMVGYRDIADAYITALEDYAESRMEEE
jgi:hypothetical protein